MMIMLGDTVADSLLQHFPIAVRPAAPAGRATWRKWDLRIALL